MDYGAIGVSCLLTRCFVGRSTSRAARRFFRPRARSVLDRQALGLGAPRSEEERTSQSKGVMSANDPQSGPRRRPGSPLCKVGFHPYQSAVLR